MRIAVLGATGRMGQRVLKAVLDHDGCELTAAIGSERSPELGKDVGPRLGRPATGTCLQSLRRGFGDAEVVIDFSLPQGTIDALPHLGARALVTGTTGLTPGQTRAIETHAQTAPVLRADNFSTGVNVLLALVARAAQSLPTYDIEVVEAHHGQKVDAPSGTATALAQAAATARGQQLEAIREDGRVGRTGPRKAGHIGLHALRGGSITGHHEIWLSGLGEHLKLVHTAESRDTFAQGALRAALWLKGRPPGLYTMAQVLGLENAMIEPSDDL